MIITLRGADFSASNIGTLSSWRITRSLGSGATYEGVTSVDKGASFSATVTIAEGYELGSAGVTVTMGGEVISAATVNGNTITISIASVTGNVVIKVPTVNLSTGDEEEPETPGDSEISSVLLTSVASSVMSGTGIASTDYTTYESEGRTTFMEIPIEPNAFYYVNHCIRVWFLDADKNTISTVNPSNSLPKFYFTTPASAVYMSITFRETLVDGSTLSPSEATLVKLSYYNPSGESTLLKNVTTTNNILSGYALQKDQYQTFEKENNTSFLEIPAVAGQTYYIKNGLRVWYLSSTKTAISTMNLVTETNIKFQFTTPDNTAYISVCIRGTNDDGTAYDVENATMVTIA